jgi:hypothetical protein
MILCHHCYLTYTMTPGGLAGKENVRLVVKATKSEGEA